MSPTLNPDTSSNDESDDDENDNDEEYNALVNEMRFVYASLRGNKEARSNVEHSMETINKYKETILDLESHIENRRLRVNLLKQELRDEKHTPFPYIALNNYIPHLHHHHSHH